MALQAYETAGLPILEPAQITYSLDVAKNSHEQARLIKTLVSNFRCLDMRCKHRHSVPRRVSN